MVEPLQRLREPAAIVVLIVTGVQILLGFASLASEGGVFVARSYVVQPFTALVLALVIGACALWRPTPHARLFALLAATGVGAQVVLGFLFSLLGLASSGPALGITGLLGTLASLAVSALLGVGVLTIYRGLPAPQRPASIGYGPQPGYPQQGYGPSGYPAQSGYPAAPGYPAQPGFAASQPSAPPPATPPWQPDPQAGQSWRTAGDAASGASAADWGGSGRDQGWQPAAPPAAPPASSASAADAPPPPAATGESGTETRIVPPAAPQPPAEPPRRPADGPLWWDQK